jgi:REP element-mobilizing transposase RayT
MPRSPRVFLEGGIYHVYNRVTRGERVFDEDQEALFLLDTMRKVRDRDDFIVLAWCIMGNHYHLAVRCTSVPLWRSMASLHTRVSRSYNARYRVYGPFWQGRYKAKLVETPEYLRQLLLYIHLNPVTAGIVERPDDYSWSGHREVVRRFKNPLVDPDQLLLAFDETRKAARRAYLSSIRAAVNEEWMDGAPGTLPWWPLGRPRREDREDELRMKPGTPYIDALGRSTTLERPLLTPDDFIDRVLKMLEITREEVAGATKRREVVRAREILFSLGVERYGLKVTEMAAALQVNYDSASLWGRRGAGRRAEDTAFARRAEEVDAAVASSPASSAEYTNV